MAYAAWSVVFGEQPSASKWNILGANDAYFDSLIGSGTAWASWTPSWTNLTAGNGVNSSVFQQFGNTVLFRLKFTLGSSSSVSGSVSFSLPVTSVNSGVEAPIGTVILIDTGTNQFVGGIEFATTTTAVLIVHNAASTHLTRAALSSTIPHVWAPTDVINGSGFYEAA